MKKVMMKRTIQLLVVILMASATIQARENVNGGGKLSSAGDGKKVLAGCAPGKAQTELKLNNVRTRILTCGDMWWDLNNAKYEVPKGSNSHASFAGSLWFGGKVGGQIRVSAMTYRQSGLDFWPGPLDPSTAEIDATTCDAWDKHYRFNRTEVDEFYADWAADGTIDNTVPSWIKDYPGNAPIPTSTFYYLAPFVDVDNSLTYDYSTGDYPAYNVTGSSIPFGSCKRQLFGDETLFWVFNDKGNTHSESGSPNPIGVEIRGQAFAFATSDELNDMTFYNYEIINRSTNTLDETYFAVWVDADLGYYNDDYIGCDVNRGLGYIYNGDNYDEDNSGQTGYHSQLPAFGCDFFQGPNADIGDGVDNDRDGCVDCTFDLDPLTLTPTGTSTPDVVLPEQIIMSRFAYYNNDGTNQGNPNNVTHYYNYMTGLWKDGTPMTWGAQGFGGTVTTKFMYPGDTDPGGNVSTGVAGNTPAVWTEVTAQAGGNAPADRRFLQSAGPFTLTPGSVNYITFGMPFVRTSSDNNFAAVPLLQTADDKAQALFNNCFKVLDGPDAPDLTVQELENELLLFLSNKPSSNNYEQKRYKEIDVTIRPTIDYIEDSDPDTVLTDRFFKFQGYMVYQLKDETVSQTDLDNADKARLIFQCDLRDNVSSIINYNTDVSLGIVPQLMTPVANNIGIQNSFKVTEDQFAEGDKGLVNHKTYYFMTIAYAYNNYLPYKQDTPPASDSSNSISGDYTGQKKPFLRGRKNIKVYSAIPHNTSVESNGTVTNTSYGAGPKVTRIEGQGNGGNFLELTQSTINNILNSPTGIYQNLEYESNQGPISVKVVDPLRVVGGNFKVKVQKPVLYTSGSNAGYDSTFVIGSRADTDSGKVKNSFKYIIEGTYTDGNGATISKTWNGQETVGIGQEHLLTGNDGELLGISVTINRSEDPQIGILDQNPNPTLEGDLLGSSITFSDPTKVWLKGVTDTDAGNETNWIRSGTTIFTAGSAFNDVFENIPKGTTTISSFADPSQVWENVVGGTWAPFRLAASSNPGTGSVESAFSPSYAQTNTSQLMNFSRVKNINFDMRTLASVDIVFTNDKSKWTRCVVLEMCHNAANSIGNQKKYLVRKSQSVDKNGVAATVGSGVSSNPNDPNYIAETGMGWFPGYAINVETGERLNLAFGENSSDPTNNGTDMIWNPTSTILNSSTGKYVMGGMHYIYVFGHNSDATYNVSGSITNVPIDVPRYDAGKALRRMLDTTITGGGGYGQFLSNGYGQSRIVEAYKDAMWVSPSTISSAYSSSFAAGVQPSIPCEVKVKIRVNKPLRYGISGTWSPSYSKVDASGNLNGTTYCLSSAANDITVDTVGSAAIPGTSQNGNFPMYSFSTYDLVAKRNDTETAKDALSLINIVPNPYYGHSKYEKQRIDTYVKIVNLPSKCTVRIYTINGTLVRTIKKDTDANTYLNWDLKNDKNIPIASGLYIFHIDAGDLGEKTLKWFGVMRPFDLQSY